MDYFPSLAFIKKNRYINFNYIFFYIEALFSLFAASAKALPALDLGSGEAENEYLTGKQCKKKHVQQKFKFFLLILKNFLSLVSTNFPPRRTIQIFSTVTSRSTTTSKYFFFVICVLA